MRGDWSRRTRFSVVDCRPPRWSSCQCRSSAESGTPQWRQQPAIHSSYLIPSVCQLLVLPVRVISLSDLSSNSKVAPEEDCGVIEPFGGAIEAQRTRSQRVRNDTTLIQCYPAAKLISRNRLPVKLTISQMGHPRRCVCPPSGATTAWQCFVR